EETVTVSGTSPVVDTQNVQTQRVLSRETLDALPIAKSLMSYVAMTLGASFASAADQDVGGSRGEFSGAGGFTLHDNRAPDSRTTLDGMTISTIIGEGSSANSAQFVNQLIIEETTVLTSGADAEFTTGGVQMNVVPKSGGNTFKTSFVGKGTWSGLQ